MKSILIVLAPKNFRDEEYAVPRAVWEKAGANVLTMSIQKISYGKLGMTVKNDFLLEEVRAGDADAIFFVGGGGCMEYLENEKAEQLAHDFVAARKPIGAICAAPRLLLKWGILKGKKCTGWDGDNALEDLARKGGAIYEKKSVIKDGKFVTADGPDSAEECALAFWETLG
ncbi:DJ-1/PfpI family protein [Candidatus Gracilibacteria bacterium]|nr:DJ-1/PfpI family protein [Candidatus Gracilibacteria bacterium]